jgi:diguanylate cyclase (GGDEF)-like protein
MNSSLPTNSDDFNPLAIYGDVRRIARIFFVFNLIILISLGAGIVILLANGNALQAEFLGATLPLVLIGFFLISKKKFEAAAIFLAVILFLLITIVATSGLGIHHISNFSFPAILIVASLVTRKRTLVFLTIFAIACVAWLVFGELAGLYTPAPLERSVPGDFVTVTVLLIATAFMVRLLTESLFQSSLEVQKELNERKRAEERLAYDALHDALTGLPNRTLFNDRLSQRLDHAHRHPQDLFAVLFIDLDRFKVVNDSLGHAVGDQLLIVSAQRLTACLRPEDTVSRLSGDEFTILLNDLAEISDAMRIAERIETQLSSTSMIENLNRVTTASIGIAVFNGSYTGPQEMLRDADSAMYRAKSMGGGHYAIFDDTMYASALALLQLEADLKRAVENQEWQVYYQPIISLPGREIIGVEALVRWRHPQRGIVNPSEFIQVAEDTGLILPIGEYVLRQACTQVKCWRDGKHPGLWVSVNLSGRQFEDRNLLNTIEKILAEAGLPGDGLQLEITESVAMKDFSYSARVLDSLDQLGIQISLDDFGNGYSSLGNLNRFPIKNLKIDPSFIKNIERIPNNEAITTAIISMGHALNIEVVAEGVETEQQLAFLQSFSCDKIQGNLISPAVPSEQLEKLLGSR